MSLKAPAEVVDVSKSAPMSRQVNPCWQIGWIVLTIILKRVLLASVTSPACAHAGGVVGGTRPLTTLKERSPQSLLKQFLLRFEKS